MFESMLSGHIHRGCGGRYEEQTEAVTIRVSGMSATVDRAFYRCSRCEDVHRTVEQREQAEKGAVEAVRAAHDLLRPREIRQLREGLRLTTEQMGDLLYGVPRTIVEGWEKGRYVQNREVDAMIRQLEDREFLEERAALGGVTLPEPLPDDPDQAHIEDPGAISTGRDGASVIGDQVPAAPDDHVPDPDDSEATAQVHDEVAGSTG